MSHSSSARLCFYYPIRLHLSQDVQANLLRGDPPPRGLDNLANHLKLIPRSWGVDHRKLTRNGHLEKEAAAGEGMSLAPAFFDDLLGVFRVQVQMQRVVRVVHVADLALARVVDGVAGEKTEAVFLETRRSNAHLLAVDPAVVL